MDPFSAIAKVFLGYLEGKAIEKWAALLFEMFFSSTATFLFIAGSLLASTQNWPISIGSGMVTSSIVATVLFRRSPLTKGMQAVLPEQEARQEVQTDLQTIQKK